MSQPAAPVGGYILDASALGLLGDKGSERSRRFMSGLVVSSLQGSGPPMRVPALCLLVAAIAKARLAEHVVRLSLEAPEGAIEVDELGAITVVQLVPVASADPAAGLDVWHAAYEAMAHQGWTLVTSQAERYAAWPDLNTLELR